MPRYIDADALRKEFSERPPDYYSTGYILDTIDELPALSTDEVRGVGEWIRIPGFHLDHEYYPARYQCDQCKHFVDSGDDRNYCPNCGARLTGGEND